MKSPVSSLLGLDARELTRRFWGRACYCHQPEPSPPVITWSYSDCVAALGRGAQAYGAQVPLTAAGMPLLPSQTGPLTAKGFAVAGEALAPETCSLAARLKNELGMPGTMMTLGCIVPAGGVQDSIANHTHRLFLMTEGAARWTLTLGADRMERTLSRGASLYAPPGTEFRIEGVDRAVVAVIAFAPIGMQSVVELLARRSFGEAPRWRGVPAAGPDGAHAEYVEDGLRRLRELLAGMRPDDPRVRGVWEELIADAGPVHNRYAQSLARPEGPLAPGGRVRLTPYLPVRSVAAAGADGSREVVVFLGTQRIRDSGPGGRLLERIVAEGEFTAGDAAAWLGEGFGWEATGPYLENLMEQGLLVAAAG